MSENFELHDVGPRGGVSDATGDLIALRHLGLLNPELLKKLERYEFLMKNLVYGYMSSEGSTNEDVYLTVTGVEDGDMDSALRILDDLMEKAR